MESIRYVVNHKHFPAYIFYCLSFVCYGVVITCLGPMIPYFAEEQNHHETYYSYLFICRAIGYFAGSILSKIEQKYFDSHKILGFTLLGWGVTSIFFSLAENDFQRGIFIMLNSLTCAQLNIFQHLCILQAFKDENLDAWLQVNHGAFGLGGLSGPLIVYFFEVKSFLIVGILALIIALPFFKIKSPEHKSQNEKSLLEKQKPKQEFISVKTGFILCVIFYFVVGQESTFGGWISSYAVIENYSNKQKATFYGTIYWISGTFFRFIFPCISGKTSSKLKFLTLFAFFTGFLDIFLIHFINPSFGMILSSVFFGMSNSVLYALCFTLSQEFNLKIQPSQGANFVLSAALGDGTLVGFVGFLMKNLDSDFLFVSMAFFNVMILFLALIVMSRFQEQVKNQEQQTQMEEIK